jgi:hypothetical protein
MSGAIPLLPPYVFVTRIEEILSSSHFPPIYIRNWSSSHPFPVFQRNYFSAFLISTMLGYGGGHEQESGVYKGAEVFLWLLRSFVLFSAAQNLLRDIPNPELNSTEQVEVTWCLSSSGPLPLNLTSRFNLLPAIVIYACVCARSFCTTCAGVRYMQTGIVISSFLHVFVFWNKNLD